MNIIHAIILGVVEGITEFLPISSTGHMILVSELLKIPQSDFLKSFEISIQLGAIFSVIFLYWKSFLSIENLKKLIVAFIPTGIIGLIFYRIIKQYFLGNYNVVLWSLFLGGVALLIFEIFYSEKENAAESIRDISYKQALGIGLFQSLAVIPGISRSASTIMGGLILGLRRKTIIEFSFLLAVPTMLAATGLDLVKNTSSFSFDQLYLVLIGFIVSFVVAMFSIKFLLNFIRNNDFTSFGLYRIIIALIFWFIIL
ncbi:MAG: undecaprenyl-diphosphate phosphatase [Candidatus Paceibacterota bacterium]